MLPLTSVKTNVLYIYNIKRVLIRSRISNTRRKERKSS